MSAGAFFSVDRFVARAAALLFWRLCNGLVEGKAVRRPSFLASRCFAPVKERLAEYFRPLDVVSSNSFSTPSKEAEKHKQEKPRKHFLLYMGIGAEDNA
ncbi:MAG: hypothetical protein GY822_17840 [Deltaproteobacteria bacterium]|nr:hypothetical protein [Deltaproteobacteria bacterium]